MSLCSCARHLCVSVPSPPVPTVCIGSFHSLAIFVPLLLLLSKRKRKRKQKRTKKFSQNFLVTSLNKSIRRVGNSSSNHGAGSSSNRDNSPHNSPGAGASQPANSNSNQQQQPPQILAAFSDFTGNLVRKCSSSVLSGSNQSSPSSAAANNQRSARL